MRLRTIISSGNRQHHKSKAVALKLSFRQHQLSNAQNGRLATLLKNFSIFRYQFEINVHRPIKHLPFVKLC